MNPFEIFNYYMSMSIALNSCVITLATNCTFPMSAIVLYETVDRLDDNDKPTGDIFPQISLSSGKEIELTPDQKEVFKPLWNQKLQVDDKLRAAVAAMDQVLTQQIATAATAAETPPKQ